MSITRGALDGRPRGLPATWRASCVGHTRPATWPQRHVVTARWTRARRQPRLGVLATSAGARHVSSAVSLPRFFDFLIEKLDFKIK